MRALAIILIIAQGSACLVLLLRGFGPRLPILIGYLLISLSRGILLAQYPRTTDEYRLVWLQTMPLILALQIGTVIEAYRRSLEELPGARRVTHRFIIVIAFVAAAVVQIPQRTFTAWGVLSLAQQAVATVLGITAIGVAALLSYLKPRRKPNAVLHERVLALHLTALAVMLALNNSGHMDWPSAVNSLVALGCCALWAIGLTPQGEQIPEVLPMAHPGGPSLGGLRGQLLAVLRGEG
jgi:peptidoglycan/LPS O-acetylase OafA/YrhL